MAATDILLFAVCSAIELNLSEELRFCFMTPNSKGMKK